MHSIDQSVSVSLTMAVVSSPIHQASLMTGGAWRPVSVSSKRNDNIALQVSYIKPKPLAHATSFNSGTMEHTCSVALAHLMCGISMGENQGNAVCSRAIWRVFRSCDLKFVGRTWIVCVRGSLHGSDRLWGLFLKQTVSRVCRLLKGSFNIRVSGTTEPDSPHHKIGEIWQIRSYLSLTSFIVRFGKIACSNQPDQ